MAPNKKYLSLEEAAAQLGIKTDELIRLREKGDVRGFADRGTWKFKADDVDEYHRRHQPDSDPDLDLIDDFSDVGDDDFGRNATVIRKKGQTDSDSDVRIVETPHSGSKSGGRAKSESTQADSDSDVRLAASDSDVRLLPASDSDSDVQLIGPKSGLKPAHSDSDVTLVLKESTGSLNSGEPAKTDAMVSIPEDLGNDHTLHLETADSSISLSQDSRVRLGNDSGISLSQDSGIRLGNDSGISLSQDSGIRLGNDSGIRLSDDSGIQLNRPADSGISLEGLGSGIRLADSGITSRDLSGSGPLASSQTFDLLAESSVTKRSASSSKPKGGAAAAGKNQDVTEQFSFSSLDEDDLGATAPLLRSGDEAASSAELDLFDSGDSSEMTSLSDSNQNVVMFEDDEDDAPPVSKKRPQKSVEESIFEIDEVAEEPLDELEVSDDDLSEESELDDLAFDDDADDLEDSFSSGSSKLGFGGAKKLPLAQEVEWSAGFFSLLLSSLCMLIAGVWVSADLLRTVWGRAEESPVYPGIAGLLSALWK